MNVGLPKTYVMHRMFYFERYFNCILFQLRDTDDDLGTGSRVLSVMIMRVQRSRIVLIGIGLAIILIIIVSIYLSFFG